MADPVPLSIVPVLVGLGPFAAGGMLLWGLVALLPIVLHLLRRRRSRTVSWGAMQFLQAAIARRAKQFQFWRLLLLLLRIAAVVLVAIALARPLLPQGPSGQAAPRRPRALHVLVVDVSYSMRTTIGERSRFQAAQEAAAALCRAAPADDRFLLLTMGNPPKPVIQNVGARAEQCIAEIRRLSAGLGRADLPATLSIVNASIAAAIRDGWNGPIDVIVFSDLQQSTWGALPNGAPPLVTARNRSATEVRSMVWDAAEQMPAGNATVGPLQRDPTGSGPPGASTWLSTVTHSGGETVQGRLAQLLVDDRVVQSQTFDLQPGGTQTLLWSTQLSAGRHAVEVRLGPDSLEADNASRTVVDISSQISVAAFGATPAETRYFALAAAPGGRGSVAVRSFEMRQLPQTELGRFDVWVLCDPPPLRDASAARIRQHLGQGGGVVWWLGPNWQRGLGGLRAAPGRGAEPLSAASPESPASEPPASESWFAREPRSPESEERRRIDPLGYRSALVQAFEPFPGSGLLSLPVFQYWELELGSNWETALAIGDGDPLIAVLSPAGAGRQVIVATPPGPGRTSDAPAAEPWNALIAWPSFVPLVQEIIRWADAENEASRSFLVGQRISGQSPESELGEVLRSEAGEKLDVKIQSRSGSTVRWTAGVAEAAGVYYWSEADGSPGGSPVFAVNVDPAEGLLQKLATLPEPWTRYAETEPREAHATADGTVDSLQASGVVDRELFWWFLLAAAGFLAAESLVVKMLEGRF